MELTRYEMETIINFNEEEATASVYTHNKALIRRLDKLAQERPEDCRRGKTSSGGKSVDYIIPKGWIRINPSRQLSEEQRAVLAERMKSNLAKKS